MGHPTISIALYRGYNEEAGPVIADVLTIPDGRHFITLRLDAHTLITLDGLEEEAAESARRIAHALLCAADMIPTRKDSEQQPTP